MEDNYSIVNDIETLLKPEEKNINNYKKEDFYCDYSFLLKLRLITYFICMILILFMLLIRILFFLLIME